MDGPFLLLKQGLDRYKSFHFGWLVFNMRTGFNIVSAKAVVTWSDIMPWAHTPCWASKPENSCSFVFLVPIYRWMGTVLILFICYWAILFILLHVCHSIVFLQLIASFIRDSKLVPTIRLPMAKKRLIPNSYQSPIQCLLVLVLHIYYPIYILPLLS